MLFLVTLKTDENKSKLCIKIPWVQSTPKTTPTVIRPTKSKTRTLFGARWLSQRRTVQVAHTVWWTLTYHNVKQSKSRALFGARWLSQRKTTVPDKHLGLSWTLLIINYYYPPQNKSLRPGNSCIIRRSIKTDDPYSESKIRKVFIYWQATSVKKRTLGMDTLEAYHPPQCISGIVIAGLVGGVDSISIFHSKISAPSCAPVSYTHLTLPTKA